MALWNNQENNKNYINLKLVATPGPLENRLDWPKLVKLWEDYKETGETFTNVVWTLKWIKPTFTPAKWKRWDIFWFKAFLEDWEEIYVIESTITNASKDLLNALLNSKWNFVKISLYVNKNWYPTSSVRNELDWFVEWHIKDFKSLTPSLLHWAIEDVFTVETKSNEISVEDIPF